MTILGIDYGRKNIGLAIAQSSLAEPLETIKWTDEAKLFSQLAQLRDFYKIDSIVLGISEGEMEKETRKFGERLASFIGIPVDYEDETLTSKEVHLKKASRKKGYEHAVAAALILESWMEKNR